MSSSFQAQEPKPFERPQTQHYPSLVSIALRRKSLIILGGVIGLVLAALYYAQRPPVYQSDLQTLVIKKRADTLPIPGIETQTPYYVEDYLATHQVLIKSPVIIGRAVKKRQLQDLKSFTGLADPTGAVIGSLTVTRDSKDSRSITNILNLSVRGNVAEDCLTVLNAVMDSYKDFLDETYKNVSDDTLELITKARDVLQKDLAHKEDEYRAFRQKSPLLWKGKQGTNLHQERLAGIESKRSSLMVRRAEIEGRLAVVDNALKEGGSRPALLATLPELPIKMPGEGSRSASSATVEEQLLPLLHQEQSLLQDYGPNHPQVQSIRRRMELTRKLFAESSKQGSQAKDEPGKEQKSRVLDPLELYVGSLKREVNDVVMAEQLLAEQFKNEYDEARKLTNYEIQEETLRNDLARTYQLYESIIKRLQEVNLVRDFGGYDARIISPATSARMIEPKAFPIFAAGLFLGILGGFGLALMADRSDKSFRTPEEIWLRLGLPIVGHIPLITPQEGSQEEVGSGAAALDPVLCAYHLPRTREAESYRMVRTALYFSMHGKDHKVIQITSPDAGDGKTTLVANLGISIAQSGKKVILVDADFRKPRLDKMFRLATRVGLASVIQGGAELNEAIQESAVSGLSVLPCGPIPPNPAELLTSPRFEELLAAIRDQYDFVLVDTPPLLAVTDPCVVAARADGVLLNIRVSKNGRPHAERAKEILNTLGVTVLGVIVNGVDRHSASGGYGYDYYRYGYSYGYTDGYHSSNGDDGYYPDSSTPQDSRATNGEGRVDGRQAKSDQGRNGHHRQSRSWLRRLLRSR